MRTCFTAPLALAILSTGILGAGCAWSIGSHGEPCKAPQPTQGQELIDLKKARDEGAITDAEYEAAKARVLTK